MAAAYDIGASVASAFGSSTPLNLTAGTTFNFNSAGARGDVVDQLARAETAATAAASGKGPVALGEGVGSVGGGNGGNNRTLLLLAIGLAVLIWFKR